MTSDEDLQEPLIERLSASPDPESTKLPSKKRKRGSTEDAPKKSKSKKVKAVEEDDLDIEAGINRAFAHMDNQLLADYLAQRTRKFESDLSTIELEDKYIPANAIQDTTAFDKPRTIENLPSFLEKFAGNTTKLWSASKMNGAPHTIIVTSAGLRAADLARAVRKFQTKDATVAKLFAKHIKIKDAIKLLNKTRTGIAVGTPARLKDLMDDGALRIDRLERIVVDASHIDIKKRGLLETKDVQVPLIQWLGLDVLREKYSAKAEGIQLLFY